MIGYEFEFLVREGDRLLTGVSQKSKTRRKNSSESGTEKVS